MSTIGFVACVCAESDDVISLPHYMKKSSSLKNKRRFSFKNISEAHAAKVLVPTITNLLLTAPRFIHEARVVVCCTSACGHSLIFVVVVSAFSSDGRTLVHMTSYCRRARSHDVVL